MIRPDCPSSKAALIFKIQFLFIYCSIYFAFHRHLIIITAINYQGLPLATGNLLVSLATGQMIFLSVVFHL